MVYPQVFYNFFFRIVTWLIKAMTNTSNNGYLTFFFHTKTPKFWSIDLLWAAWILSKINAPKYFFVIVNFKNVVIHWVIVLCLALSLAHFLLKNVETLRDFVWYVKYMQDLEKRVLNLCNTFFHITLELSHTI